MVVSWLTSVSLGLRLSNRKGKGMSKGREHDERRKSQAAAARKHRNRKRFHKGSRNRYSEEGD
jgi:hypothetical protein